MYQRIIAILFVGTLLNGVPSATYADGVPKVVVTVKPVHGIVSAVMVGVGEPALLLPDNASPHTYALKPSDARSLSRADLVVRVGDSLESFLHDALENLAPDARILELVAVDGMSLLATREGGVWDRHDHGHDDGHAQDEHEDRDEHTHDEHGHDDDHDEHAHDEHGHDDDHDEHAHDEHGHDDDHDEHAEEHHAEEAVDPHLWFDIANARLIADIVAETLAALDPGHAVAYRGNAVDLKRRLAELDDETRAALEPVRETPFIVFHDAYQYLETHFGLAARGSITIDPDRSPSAKRIAELRHLIEERGARCIFSEPQFAPRIVETLVEGTAAGVGVLDPIGVGIEPGPAAYETLIRRNVETLRACLADG